MARVTLLEALYDAQRVQVVVEPKAVAAQTLVQCALAGVAEGRVADVVDQRKRLGQIDVQAKRRRNLACDLCDLDGVGKAAAEVVGCAAGKDLRLAGKTAEGARLHDPVAVALEGAAAVSGGRGEGARGQGQFLVAEDRTEPQRFRFGGVFDHCWQCSATTANFLWVCTETSAFMSVFPQKNGTEQISPPHGNRKFALLRGTLANVGQFHARAFQLVLHMRYIRRIGIRRKRGLVLRKRALPLVD